MRTPRPLRSGLGQWPRLAVLARTLGERYALAALIFVSLVLVVIGKADIKAVVWLNSRVGDAVAPLLSALKEPVSAARDLADGMGALLALDAENRRLRDENRRLMVWQAEAARLEVENGSLRQTLKMPKDEAAPLWTTARVVADPGGPFLRTLLIDAGQDRGVLKGMAVVDESGLVGRVVAVGSRSARVLLLTDLNSKIPVITQRSRDQAILEGTNGRLTELRFLPSNPNFTKGDRVLTSGRGGILPAGLLIGEIDEIHDQKITVLPYVDWDRLDHVAVLEQAPVPSPDGAATDDLSHPPAIMQPLPSPGRGHRR